LIREEILEKTCANFSIGSEGKTIRRKRIGIINVGELISQQLISLRQWAERADKRSIGSSGAFATRGKRKELT
jgi:hypothetical protein